MTESAIDQAAQGVVTALVIGVVALLGWMLKRALGK